MKKNLRTKFGFLFAIFFLLSSCRTELLDNENQTNLAKQSYIIKQLNYEQLKQQAPIVVEKISAFKTISNPQSINSKIYNDKEEGFTVNTESAIYIENEKGEKTYTFKIEKRESDSEILENLVLKEIGNSEYEAFISTYDKFVLENLSKLSLEELKRHVSMVPIGKRTSSDIFGKYNADPCQVMMPVGIFDYTIPGNLCSEGVHDYAHIGGCNGNLPGSTITLPTPDFNFSALSYGTFDICGGGGASGGVGSSPVSTAPHSGGSGGGGGWNGDSTTIECSTLKNNLQKAKDLIEQDSVKAKNNTMKATILTDTSEKAFYWGKDVNGKIKTSTIFPGGVGYTNLPISSSLFTPEAYGHNHNGTDGYTNFSSTDINQFHDYHAGFPTLNHNFANGSDGSLYVMTIENQSDFDTFVGQYPMSSIDIISPTNPNGTGDWKEDTDIHKDERDIYYYFRDQGKSQDEAMDLTMGYLIQKYNMGIMISKKGTDGKFHPIQVKTITDLFGIPIAYVKTNPCNL